jgi:hypothetical protein
MAFELDPFSNPDVQKRMLELQQRKYRQGHRNTTNKKGNPAYALTDEDRISCLPSDVQVKVRTNMQRLRKLEEYADPFTFTVGTGEYPPKYIVNITHPSWGHSRRSDPVSMVDRLPNPEVWFKQKIDEMKRELGYTMFANKRNDLQSKIEQKKKQGYSVTDKRSKKVTAPMHCPDHGNELVRGTDPGTLVCTVVGCKKVARKKVRPTAVTAEKVTPPAVTELTDAEMRSLQAEKAATKASVLADLENIKKQFAEVTLNMDAVGPTSTVAAMQRIVTAMNPSHYTPNDNKPKLVSAGGRFYLAQYVGPGREAYVDVTNIVAARQQAVSGMHYANVPPVTLNTGEELLALKLPA